MFYVMFYLLCVKVVSYVRLGRSRQLLKSVNIN